MLQKTKIACLLCRGLISFKNGDRSRFLDHMNNEHDARYDFDVVLVVSLLTEGEKKVFVNTNQSKLEALTGSARKEEVTANNSKSKELITPKVKHSIEDVKQMETTETQQTQPSRSESKVIASEQMVAKPKQVDPKVTTSEPKEASEKETTNGIDTVSEPNVVEPVKMEGDLKCKICSKYIKQSELLDHRQTHAGKETESTKIDVDENMLEVNARIVGQRSPQNDNEKGETVREIKTLENNVDEESPKKGKRKGGDSEDEDWVASKVMRKNHKSLPCNKCKKKFSSKLGLTTHERMVHRVSERNVPKPTEKTHLKEAENQRTFKMQTNSQACQTKIPNQQSMSEPLVPAANEPNLKLQNNQPIKQKPTELSSQKLKLVAHYLQLGAQNQQAKPRVLGRRTDALPSESKYIEQIKEINTTKQAEDAKQTNELSKKLTPIGTSTKMYVPDEESLLVDDFDFEEEEAPLTIDEGVETVTVQIGENSKYLDFGEISPLDSLFLDNIEHA